MKTLSEHNREIEQRNALIRSLQAVGVVCDECGTEMVFSHKSITGTSCQWVRRPSCKVDRLKSK